jgi:plasmid stabilization system protein ParE
VIALRILPEAEDELAEAAEWYESKRVGLGVELVAVVDRAIDEILDAPASFPFWRSDRPYRRKVISRFPYVIFFRATDKFVEITAVAHAMRRPGYWVGRAAR